MNVKKSLSYAVLCVLMLSYHSTLANPFSGSSQIFKQDESELGKTDILQEGKNDYFGRKSFSAYRTVMSSQSGVKNGTSNSAFLWILNGFTFGYSVSNAIELELQFDIRAIKTSNSNASFLGLQGHFCSSSWANLNVHILDFSKHKVSNADLYIGGGVGNFLYISKWPHHVTLTGMGFKALGGFNYRFDNSFFMGLMVDIGSLGFAGKEVDTGTSTITYTVNQSFWGMHLRLGTLF